MNSINAADHCIHFAQGAEIVTKQYQETWKVGQATIATEDLALEGALMQLRSALEEAGLVNTL